MAELPTEDIATLADGTRVLLRPIRPGDKEQLVEGFGRMSPDSRYRRFLRPVTRLSERELRYLTEIDYIDHFAWVALAVDEPSTPGLGVARYVRDPDDPGVAESAIAVVDDFQGRGLGTLLMVRLMETARSHGIERFRSYVLSDNRAMIELLRAFGAVTQHGEDRQVRIEMNLPDEYELSALREAFRAVAAGDVETEPIA